MKRKINQSVNDNSKKQSLLTSFFTNARSNADGNKNPVPSTNYDVLPKAEGLKPQNEQAGSQLAHSPVIKAHGKPKSTKFEYFVVLDLEATCDRNKNFHPQEIIEISAVLLNANSSSIDSEFQQYVRPTVNPVLTTFCTELTGITQDRVNNGVPLEAAFSRFDQWLTDNQLQAGENNNSFAMVIWSNWDFQVQVERECSWRHIKKPAWALQWINLQKMAQRVMGRTASLTSVVDALGLCWSGHHHSALDDARNTARVAVKLMERGCELDITGSFPAASAGQGTSPVQTKLKAGGNGSAIPAVRVIKEDGSWTGKCFCGATAKLRTAKKPGPNLGRSFYSCGHYTILNGAPCQFFKWIEDVTKS